MEDEKPKRDKRRIHACMKPKKKKNKDGTTDRSAIRRRKPNRVFSKIVHRKTRKQINNEKKQFRGKVKKNKWGKGLRRLTEVDDAQVDDEKEDDDDDHEEDCERLLDDTQVEDDEEEIDGDGHEEYCERLHEAHVIRLEWCAHLGELSLGNVRQSLKLFLGFSKLFPRFFVAFPSLFLRFSGNISGAIIFIVCPGAFLRSLRQDICEHTLCSRCDAKWRICRQVRQHSSCDTGWPFCWQRSLFHCATIIISR